MRYYDTNASRLRLTTPSTKLIVLGTASNAMVGITATVKWAVDKIVDPFILTPEIVAHISNFFLIIIVLFLTYAVGSFIIAGFLNKKRTDAQRIRHLVRQTLYLSENGNPLHLKDGERLPRVSCDEIENGKFVVTISTAASTVDEIENVVASVSAGLKGKKFRRFAITTIDTDVAYNYVRFTVEDVTVQREIVAEKVDDLLSGDVTKLRVQNGTEIDLTSSGSMLVAGKTRSGKTTGVIAILLQVLKYGRDNYGSTVTIIDPKRAELSMLSNVVTIDPDGQARSILNAVRDFADLITKRQSVLNELSSQSGDAVKWWNADMKPSFLFIDEYVALRAILPAKASKDEPEYSLAAFDALMKRIVTMGASAGCFVIISIAEASVESGGLPAMLRSAMSTRILFRPTLPEARLMWESEKLQTMPTRTYRAGDAWFSSTDGVHDNVSHVHFPILNISVYRELGKLLDEYYA